MTGGAALCAASAAPAAAQTAAFFALDARKTKSQVHQSREQDRKQYIQYVHKTGLLQKSISTSRTTSVTTQAIAHCPRTSAAAQPRPISRLTEATAATQGV